MDLFCSRVQILPKKSERLLEAFKQLDLMVVVDIYRNATAEYADYVLPAVDWLEREDANALASGLSDDALCAVHRGHRAASPRAPG